MTDPFAPLPPDLRALVVGGGGWGTNLIRTLHASARLGGVCEAHEARRESLKLEHPGVPVFASMSQMLGETPDLPVIVATPPFTHHRVALEALEAHRDVLVEKPMTVSTGEAAALVEAAARGGRILMVGHLLLYHAAFQTLKQRLHELGDLRYLHQRRLNLGRVRSEENVLWSFAPHDIAVLLHLLEELPERVSCVGGAWVQPTVEDVSMLTLLFPSGRLATIQVGWLEPERVRRLTLVGSKGSAVIDELAEKPLRFVFQTVAPETLRCERTGEEAPDLPDTQPLAAECLHFLECVRDRTTPRSPGEQGLAVVNILESASHSLRNGGQWTKVNHEQLRARVSSDR